MTSSSLKTLPPPPNSAVPSPAELLTEDGHGIRWFDTGESFLQAQIEAIQKARHSIRLEQYIYARSWIGERFRLALTEAARRGVAVSVLIDSLGSRSLPPHYFDRLSAAGGSVAWFNPLQWKLLTFRNHRKLMVVDEEAAYVGGCNIAPEYAGDGVTGGWRDGGISIAGPVVVPMIEAFEEQRERADQCIWKVSRKVFSGWIRAGENVSLLLQRPGLRQNDFQKALRADLRNARTVSITAAYFLPVGKLRRALLRTAQRAESFRLLLPARSDVPILQVATRALYRKFQRRGAQIFEYQPQNLHAKIIVMDDVVYVGSANLDPRSLAINFEIVLRIRSRALAERARETFERDLQHSNLISRRRLVRRSGWWQRLKQKLSFLLFCRLDLAVAQVLLRRAELHGRTGS